MKKIAYANLNGKVLPLERANVSVMDRGFLYGDGVYETIRVYRGFPFDFNSHLKRLKMSAKTVGIKVPVSDSAFLARAKALVRKSGLLDGTLRIWLTRGRASRFGFEPSKASSPTLLLSIAPSPPIDEKIYREGIAAVLSSVRRNSPLSLPPSAKTTNGLNGILAMKEAERLNAREAILAGQRGNIVEGSVSNVFAVRSRTLFTPALDGELLAGVTRARILRIAKKAGFRVVEKILWPNDLMKADEVFISNAYLEALGVRKLIVQSPTGAVQRAVIRFRRPKASLLIRDLYRKQVAAVSGRGGRKKK